MRRRNILNFLSAEMSQKTGRLEKGKDRNKTELTEIQGKREEEIMERIKRTKRDETDETVIERTIKMTNRQK